MLYDGRFVSHTFSLCQPSSCSNLFQLNQQVDKLNEKVNKLVG